MPWNESTRMDERRAFVMACLSGHFTITDLCERADISRRTGYKWLDRFVEEGEAGLVDRSHAPHRCPHKTSNEVAQQLLALRRAHPFWGPRKLLQYGKRRWPEVHWPSHTTAAVLLREASLVKPRRRRPQVPRTGQPARPPAAPNELWTVDFKGQFRTGDQRYCYPLTVLDLHSRYLLGCRALLKTHVTPTDAAMDRLFRKYGLPEALHFDWGSPFAGSGLAGLTRLSLKWLKLGIRLERSRPAFPQDNACHERMHRTLKAETARPAAQTLSAQQRRFDRFCHDYNTERPHQAIGDRTPHELYRSSLRPYPRHIPDPHYPHHFLARRVSPRGELHLHRRDWFLGSVLARETVGLEEIDDGVWFIYFGPTQLAYLDEQTGRLAPVPV